MSRLKIEMNRRSFLATFAATLFSTEKLPPIRAITRGPNYHWFGYYDKLQFDPTNRYALGIEGTFEHRLPTPNDKVKVGMVDIEDNDRWIELGESRSWSWHQTCMLNGFLAPNQRFSGTTGMETTLSAIFWTSKPRSEGHYRFRSTRFALTLNGPLQLISGAFTTYGRKLDMREFPIRTKMWRLPTTQASGG